MRINRMALPSANIDILWRWVYLSLLMHLFPLKYWDEAFLTATYLINRLPSKVIQSQAPMERLFGKSGDYSLLRIFGCAGWPNL
jgi:histone deacetylase 1/2